jgi:hypothetical protein
VLFSRLTRDIIIGARTHKTSHFPPNKRGSDVKLKSNETSRNRFNDLKHISRDKCWLASALGRGGEKKRKTETLVLCAAAAFAVSAATYLFASTSA